MSTEHWPEFVSHKVVRAAPIVGIASGEGMLIVETSKGALEAFKPTEPAMIQRAEIGGYAVVYDDGRYQSVSPKGTFESGYTLKAKPTVEELDAILGVDDGPLVEVQDDGSCKPVDPDRA